MVKIRSGTDKTFEHIVGLSSFFGILSPRPARLFPNPQLTPPSNTRREYTSDLYISSKDSEHKQYQNDLIEICTEKLTKEFRA